MALLCLFGATPGAFCIFAAVIAIVVLLILNLPYRYNAWFKQTAEGKRKWLACISSGSTALACDSQTGFQVNFSKSGLEERIQQFVAHYNSRSDQPD
jgi:hypothetical protein